MSIAVFLKREKRVSYDKGETFSEEIDIVWHAVITDNLKQMAREAGIYEVIWLPEDTNMTAGEIINRLTKALDDLKKRPEHFKKFNPPVLSWKDTYEDFFEFVLEYLCACVSYPSAIIEVLW